MCRRAGLATGILVRAMSFDVSLGAQETVTSVSCLEFRKPA